MLIMNDNEWKWPCASVLCLGTHWLSSDDLSPRVASIFVPVDSQAKTFCVVLKALRKNIDEDIK